MIGRFVLKVRRAESPFYFQLKRAAKAVLRAHLPVPDLLRPVFRGGFFLQHGIKRSFAWLLNGFYREPLFRGRCDRVGRNFRLNRMPFVLGHAEIEIGNDVAFYGQVDIFSGRIFDHPKLQIGNGVNIGHGVTFVVNREIVIEDGVNVSSGVRIMDTDSHPRDAESRIAQMPPLGEEVKPVRIGRYSWIGEHSYILKGVTVGEGAIIGVNSVVVTDIPPYTIAMGNPARVVVKNGLKAVPVEQQPRAS